MVLTANYIDIDARAIYPVRLSVEEGRITSVEKIDEVLTSYILPGFIDAHIHIESSMLLPSEFARVAVGHGSVAAVCDPHEIANVLGKEGVAFMLENADKVAFNFFFGVPSCVPATPFETSGAVLDSRAVETLLNNPKITHLSEMMAFPSVLAGEPEVMAKIAAAKRAGKPVDGHAPALRGDELSRYIAAGISTDHEAFSYEEAKEKLSKGMKILIREGSAAKNFEALAPLIGEAPEALMFCSDDRHPDDLVREHINALVVRSIAKGFDLFDVLRIACLNPIEHYGLDVGRLRLGDAADFIEVGSLEGFELIRTFVKGEVVYENNTTRIPSVDIRPINNFCAKAVTAASFRFESGCERVEVIEVIDHELMTKHFEVTLPDSDQPYAGEPEKDILKIAVINRYEPSEPALAFIRGFGLKSGAIASSIAHDSHNIIAVGCSDEALALAVNRIIETRGGITAVGEGEVHHLPLDVAGIMSSGDAFGVARAYGQLDSFVKGRLGSPLDAPFMSLSFMALLVIPELKLSDKGLFDGRSFHFVPACVREEKVR